jgi:hypothetical protein
MKLFAPTLLLTIAALAVPTLSHAACTGNSLSQGQLNTLLNGHTVCGRPGANYPGNASDIWQEQHRPGGALFDFKLGTDPMDPTKQVGDWDINNVSGTGTVRHRYPAGGPLTFTWQVFRIDGTSPVAYSFCTLGNPPQEHVVATVKTGVAGGCASTDFPTARASVARSAKPGK